MADHKPVDADSMATPSIKALLREVYAQGGKDMAEKSEKVFKTMLADRERIADEALEVVKAHGEESGAMGADTKAAHDALVTKLQKLEGDWESEKKDLAEKLAAMFEAQAGTEAALKMLQRGGGPGAGPMEAAVKSGVEVLREAAEEINWDSVGSWRGSDAVNFHGGRVKLMEDTGGFASMRKALGVTQAMAEAQKAFLTVPPANQVEPLRLAPQVLEGRRGAWVSDLIPTATFAEGELAQWVRYTLDTTAPPEADPGPYNAVLASAEGAEANQGLLATPTVHDAQFEEFDAQFDFSARALRNVKGLVDMLPVAMLEGAMRTWDLQSIVGSGVSPNVPGILTQLEADFATQLSYTTQSAATNPNTLDAIRLAARRLFERDRYGIPTVSGTMSVLMDAPQSEKIDTLKDSEDRYLLDAVKVGTVANVWTIGLHPTNTMAGQVGPVAPGTGPGGGNFGPKMLMGTFDTGCVKFEREGWGIFVSSENKDNFVKKLVTYMILGQFGFGLMQPHAFEVVVDGTTPPP